MRVFISHSFNDTKFANKLKKILEKNEEIEEAYMAKRSKNFKVVISKKITDEIKRSDYLVLIATKNAQCSASTNQEVGFAQGLPHIEIIPMVFRNKKRGVFLQDKDAIGFTKENFEKKCNEVLDHIIAQGSTRKPYTEEERILVQKSAYYRYEVHRAIIWLLDSIFLRFDLGDMSQRYKLFEAKNSEWKLDGIIQIKEFLGGELNELIAHLSIITFEKFRKFEEMGYQNFSALLKSAKKRLPHSELFQEESDLLVKLEDFIRNLPDGNFDLSMHVKQFYNFMPLASSCYADMPKTERPNHAPVRRQMEFIIRDLEELINIIINLHRIHLDYKKKFGDIAFKQ